MAQVSHAEVGPRHARIIRLVPEETERVGQGPPGKGRLPSLAIGPSEDELSERIIGIEKGCATQALQREIVLSFLQVKDSETQVRFGGDWLSRHQTFERGAIEQLSAVPSP